MSHSSPFTRYAEQAAVVTQQMLAEPDNTPVTFGGVRPGGVEVFKWAGRHAHMETIKGLGDSVPPILGRRNVLYGMGIISRFVHMSATQANNLGLGPDRYLHSLTNSATFPQTLGAIAAHNNFVAEGLERSYGLRGISVTPDTLARYRFRVRSGIELADMDSLVACYRKQFVEQGGVLQDEVVCAAHRSGALEDIFDAVAPVYATHPMLGGAIFTRTQATDRLPAAFTSV